MRAHQYNQSKLLKISLSSATPWPCPTWHEEMREKPNCSAIDEKTGMVTLSLRPKGSISSVSVATIAPGGGQRGVRAAAGRGRLRRVAAAELLTNLGLGVGVGLGLGFGLGLGLGLGLGFR